MPRDFTIPVLPCGSLADTIAFYALLGFTVTYKQSAPYLYLALKRGDADLHFHGLPIPDPSKTYSTCLWMVSDVESLHAEFAAALRAAYGKLPINGAPRISRFRPGQTRFTLVDPNGNSVVVIRHDERGKQPERPVGPISPLGRVLRKAARWRDFRNDDAGAAELLDAALARDDAGPPIDRARALLARAEIALALGDPQLAERARSEAAAIDLPADERARLQPELDALARLQRE